MFLCQVTKIVIRTLLFENVFFTLVSLWAPDGAPEAVSLEFNILMAKRSLQELAGVWEMGRSRGVLFKRTKSCQGQRRKKTRRNKVPICIWGGWNARSIYPNTAAEGDSFGKAHIAHNQWANRTIHCRDDGQQRLTNRIIYNIQHEILNTRGWRQKPVTQCSSQRWNPMAL